MATSKKKSGKKTTVVSLKDLKAAKNPKGGSSKRFNPQGARRHNVN